MGNWASTLAQQDAQRTRLVLVFVCVTVSAGLILVCVTSALMYKSKRDRQERLEQMERAVELEEMRLKRQALEAGHQQRPPPPPHSGPVAFILQDPHPAIGSPPPLLMPDPRCAAPATPPVGCVAPHHTAVQIYR